MYNSKVRNIELPENLFSNLGEMKSKKIMTKHPLEEQKQPTYSQNEPQETTPKLTNYAHRKEYRDRINKMYEDLKDIKPIDNEVDDVLYYNNYIEKGIVIKPKVSSLKQFWTEYRLIKNEKSTEKEKQNNVPLDNFDELFEALSMRVSEINKYIEELKEMRTNIDLSNNKLEEDKEKLSKEQKEFQTYKKKEEKKLKEEKENLKINFDRLQTIIDDLDKKLTSIDK